MAATLFIGDLSICCSEKYLLELFQSYGPVVKLEIKKCQEEWKFLGYGFVTMSTRLCAEFAIAGLNGMRILGRNLKVNWANNAENNFDPVCAEVSFSFLSRQLKNIVYEQTIYDLFSLHNCEILDVRIKQFKIEENKNQHSGNGFVLFPLTPNGVLSAKRAMYLLGNISFNQIMFDCNMSVTLGNILMTQPCLDVPFIGNNGLIVNFPRDKSTVTPITVNGNLTFIMLSQCRHLIVQSSVASNGSSAGRLTAGHAFTFPTQQQQQQQQAPEPHPPFRSPVQHANRHYTPPNPNSSSSSSNQSSPQEGQQKGMQSKQQETPKPMPVQPYIQNRNAIRQFSNTFPQAGIRINTDPNAFYGGFLSQASRSTMKSVDGEYQAQGVPYQQQKPALYQQIHVPQKQSSPSVMQRTADHHYGAPTLSQPSPTFQHSDARKFPAPTGDSLDAKTGPYNGLLTNSNQQSVAAAAAAAPKSRIPVHIPVLKKRQSESDSENEGEEGSRDCKNKGDKDFVSLDHLSINEKHSHETIKSHRELSGTETSFTGIWSPFAPTFEWAAMPQTSAAGFQQQQQLEH